jgi:hypothetical protein
MSSEPITSACPCCGRVAARMPYDIGSGLELSCVGCGWCWGVFGQPLRPLDIGEAMGGVDQRGDDIETSHQGDPQ